MYDLNIVIDRICSQCKQKGISVNQMLIASNAGKSLVDNMKKGRNPSIDRIFLVAKYLNTTSDYLLGLTDTPHQENQTLSEPKQTVSKHQRQELLNNYDMMNQKGQQALLSYSDYLAKQSENLKASDQNNKIVS